MHSCAYNVVVINLLTTARVSDFLMSLENKPTVDQIQMSRQSMSKDH